MSRYSWTIKTAAQAVGSEPGAVYLALHGLDATTPEIKLPASEYEPDSVESGVLDVDGELGELQTGLLRTQGATRSVWPVDWVRVVHLGDGREWTAQGGPCDPEGSCPLLRFERTREPMNGQAPEEMPAPITRPTVRTYEIYGMEKGRVVPLSQILRIASGVRTLSPGARVFIADADSQGFGLAGEPGMWEALYPGVSPAAYGLDADKPVLASDGACGWVLDAHYLAMLFGAGWRRVVYGN
jgi:hypothetical protein